MARRRERLRVVLFLAVGAGLTALVVLAYATGLLGSLELGSVDSRFEIRGAQPAPKDVAVVKVDDVSFGELKQQWPFPRSLHAKAVDRIARAGAKVIAYDVQFTEPTEPAEDNALVEAVGRAGNLVLATSEVDQSGNTQVLGGGETLRRLSARPGNSILPIDSGGVVRRFNRSSDFLKSFGLVAAERALGRSIGAPEFPEGGALIDYRGPPGTIPAVSFSRVVAGKVPDSFFRGKVVVVGVSAPSLHDLHPASTAPDGLMPGAEIEASAAWSAMHGFPLRVTPGWLNVLLIALMGIVVPLAALRLKPLWLLLLALGLGAAYVVGVQVAFESGRVLPFTYPLAALALASVGALAVHYTTAAFERERVREIFSRFVPETVVDDVLERADGLRLGGERRVCTVMFTDLRGFTSFSEGLEPDQVIEVLNRYMTEMSEAIMDNGGTLTAYLGDGIMALFGAPVHYEDHADRALAAAREMLGARLERFNGWLREEGYDEEGFKMGIGLNTGEVMCGNVGSEKRLEYTALGDTCNTASRLESMTKGTPYQCFVADSTWAVLGGETDDLTFVDELAVRGRSGAVRVWGLELAAPARTPDAADDRRQMSARVV